MEDFDSATQPSQKRSTQKLDNRGGSVSLLIRISHKARRAGRACKPNFKGVLAGWLHGCTHRRTSEPMESHPPCLPAPPAQNPAMSVAKNHHQIVLRAGDAAEKFEWLARLRNASDPRGGMGRAGPLSTTSQQLAAQQQQQPGAASAAGSRRTTGSSSVDREPPAPPASAEKKVRWGGCGLHSWSGPTARCPTKLCCCMSLCSRQPVCKHAALANTPALHQHHLCLSGGPSSLLLPAGLLWAHHGEGVRPLWWLWRQQAGQRDRGAPGCVLACCGCLGRCPAASFLCLLHCPLHLSPSFASLVGRGFHQGPGRASLFAWLCSFSHLLLGLLLLQVGSIEDLDAYYERLGTFTGLYARHIFNRMSKTVPKAIVLCQVGAAPALAPSHCAWAQPRLKHASAL